MKMYKFLHFLILTGVFFDEAKTSARNSDCKPNTFCYKAMSAGLQIASTYVRENKLSRSLHNLGPFTNLTLSSTDAFSVSLIGTVCSKFNYLNNVESRRDVLTIGVSGLEVTGMLFPDHINDKVTEETPKDPSGVCHHLTPLGNQKLPKPDSKCIPFKSRKLLKTKISPFSFIASNLQFNIDYIAHRDGSWVVEFVSPVKVKSVAISDAKCSTQDSAFRPVCQCLLKSGLFIELLNANNSPYYSCIFEKLLNYPKFKSVKCSIYKPK